MKVVHKQPQDSLEICPRTDCCGSDACYVTELSPKIKNYFCFGCGFTTNDLMIHGEFDFSQYEETLPEIYKDLKVGDVSFHHGLTFHRAKPNLSNSDRIVHTAIFFADGSTRGDDKFHFCVDRSNIQVGDKIQSDVTPLAYPIESLPDRPKTGISDDFIGYKMLGLLPRS